MLTWEELVAMVHSSQDSCRECFLRKVIPQQNFTCEIKKLKKRFPALKFSNFMDICKKFCKLGTSRVRKFLRGVGFSGKLYKLLPAKSQLLDRTPKSGSCPTVSPKTQQYMVTLRQVRKCTPRVLTADSMLEHRLKCCLHWGAHSLTEEKGKEEMGKLRLQTGHHVEHKERCQQGVH